MYKEWAIANKEFGIFVGKTINNHLMWTMKVAGNAKFAPTYETPKKAMEEINTWDYKDNRTSDYYFVGVSVKDKGQATPEELEKTVLKKFVQSLKDNNHG